MTIFNVVDNELALTPMKTGKTRSWLGEYHWVSLPVTDDNKYDDTSEKAAKWCHDSFGNSGARWFEQERKFYFKDEKDMTIFILRWS